MMTRVPVKDRKEGRLIRRALEDPETRALVVIVGALMPMTKRAQRRTLSFVMDSLDEDMSFEVKVP